MAGLLGSATASHIHGAGVGVSGRRGGDDRSGRSQRRGLGAFRRGWPARWCSLRSSCRRFVDGLRVCETSTPRCMAAERFAVKSPGKPTHDTPAGASGKPGAPVSFHMARPGRVWRWISSSRTPRQVLGGAGDLEALLEREPGSLAHRGPARGAGVLRPLPQEGGPCPRRFGFWTNAAPSWATLAPRCLTLLESRNRQGRRPATRPRPCRSFSWREGRAKTSAAWKAPPLEAAAQVPGPIPRARFKPSCRGQGLESPRRGGPGRP